MPEATVASDLLSLREAAARTGLSASHLRLLAKNRLIDATKVGSYWLTTEAAVRAYLANEALRSKDPYKRRRGRLGKCNPLGVVGGMAGIPIGGTLANWVLVEMGRAGGGTRVPEVILDPLGPAVACLALVGVVVAGIGAWVPAGLAARRAIAPDLRAE